MGKEILVGSLIAIAGLGGGYFMSQGASEAPTGQAAGKFLVEDSDDGDGECGSTFEITTYDVDGNPCAKAYEVTEDGHSLAESTTEYCEPDATEYFIQDADDGGFRVVSSDGGSSTILDTLYGCQEDDQITTEWSCTDGTSGNAWTSWGLRQEARRCLKASHTFSIYSEGHDDKVEDSDDDVAATYQCKNADGSNYDNGNGTSSGGCDESGSGTYGCESVRNRECKGAHHMDITY
jgi:hypothetical protein